MPRKTKRKKLSASEAAYQKVRKLLLDNAVSPGKLGCEGVVLKGADIVMYRGVESWLGCVRAPETGRVMFLRGSPVSFAGYLDGLNRAADNFQVVAQLVALGEVTVTESRHFAAEYARRDREHTRSAKLAQLLLLANELNMRVVGLTGPDTGPNHGRPESNQGEIANDTAAL